MPDISHHGRHTEKPPQAGVQVLGACAGAAVVDDRLDGGHLGGRE